MSKSTNAEATPGLKDKVQALRDMARKILRARMISEILQDIFNINRGLAENAKSIPNAVKDLSRADYKLSKLDPADPDFETQKARTEEYIKAAKDILARTEKSAESEKTRLKNVLKNAETKIAAIEAGEIKVDIDAVKTLTDKFIETSL